MTFNFFGTVLYFPHRNLQFQHQAAVEAEATAWINILTKIYRSVVTRQGINSVYTDSYLPYQKYKNAMQHKPIIYTTLLPKEHGWKHDGWKCC